MPTELPVLIGLQRSHEGIRNMLDIEIAFVCSCEENDIELEFSVKTEKF